MYGESIGVGILLFLNRFFKKPVHPFNLEDAGIKTFAEWEFEQSKRINSYYLPEIDLLKEIQGKIVLDIGAGGGGKRIFYALNDAKKVIGIDIEKGFIKQAKAFAFSKNAKNVEFILANAEKMPFSDNSIGICIMNDVFEHFTNPEAILKEAARVLKPNGKVFVNSPPYFHPYGAHLSDLIGIPYAHLLFPESSLINAYKKLAENTKSYKKRVNLRFGIVNGKEKITYINRMTVKRFDYIIKNQKEFKTLLYKLIPLRKSVNALLKTPLKETFTKMIVFVGEKGEGY